MKKGLLVLFGLWRNFDDMYPQVINEFDGYDIVVSTWDSDYGPMDEYSREVTEERILKAIPNSKQIIISDFWKNFIVHYNTSSMVFHWRNAIDSIGDSLNDYKVIVLHRFDLLINTKKILKYDVEPCSIYVDPDDRSWINDWVLVGDSIGIKQFLNTWPPHNEYKTYFDSINIGKDAHFPLGHIIEKSKVNRRNLTHTFKGLWYNLMKWHPSDGENYIVKYNNAGLRFYELEKNMNSKHFRVFYNEMIEKSKSKGSTNYLTFSTDTP
jgi:hypothetical protein